MLAASQAQFLGGLRILTFLVSIVSCMRFEIELINHVKSIPNLFLQGHYKYKQD